MSKKILFTVFLTVVIGVGFLIFFFNAQPKGKLILSPPANVPAADSAAFRHTLAALMGNAIVEGNSVELLKNGEQFYPAMLEAIAGAEYSVTMETYEYFGDEIAPAFAKALAERAAAGVKVHVILDFIGALLADRELFKLMEGAGVELVLWREPSWYQSSRFNHRTHRKLLIIDGRVGFTGGANTADPWKGNPSEGGYRENHFRLCGPIVAQLQAAFLDNWLSARNEILLGDAYFPVLAPHGDIAAQVVISSPREGAKRIRTLFLLAIGSAQDHIRIATAYLYPDYVMKDALVAAAERGVQVDILAPGEGPEQGIVRFASRNTWGELLEASIRIHEYQPSNYHAKAVIVDDAWATIGSANFDNRSFRINDEANVSFFSSEIVRELIEQYDADLEVSKAYDLERWKARGLVERLLGRLGNLVGPHL